jgi:hypothetical protein
VRSHRAGGPGAGVSEQCAKLADSFGCQHLVVGKLMRAEVMAETDEGKAIAQMMNDGKIIPATVYANLYKKAIASAQLEPSAAGTPAATCLLDGFPRSTDNAKLFDEQVRTGRGWQGAGGCSREQEGGRAIIGSSLTSSSAEHVPRRARPLSGADPLPCPSPLAQPPRAHRWASRTR